MPSLVHVWTIVMLSSMVCLSRVTQNRNVYRMQLPGCWREQRNLLKSLHWLAVEKRIDFKMLLLVYHALHDHALEYMRYVLQERTNDRVLLCNKKIALMTYILGRSQTAKLITKLQRIQNIAARIITGCQKHDHTSMNTVEISVYSFCIILIF